MNLRLLLAAVATLVLSANVHGQDRASYERRAAATFVEWFQALDRDGSGSVTWLETQGDLNFAPRFDDMDINRDGIVTRAELDRFIEQRFGARPG